MSGLRKVAVALVRATERSGGRKVYLVRNACINNCKHTLKFSNYVLVRVPINNYNYEQPIALFVILVAKKKFAKVEFNVISVLPTTSTLPIQSVGLGEAI